ncbi:MAG: TROVE domain-containing protein [Verrucomicrobia bacterium]|nr:TROVE domain-containing protein [Verrucomicrobiota bacterium]
MKKNIRQALTGLQATETSQGLPIPGRDMVENNAGGFVFKLDEWKQLERFLILGSEGGTFYVSEKKLSADNANKVLLLLKKDGVKVVEKTVEILKSGRAPKPDVAIFVLALAASKGDDATRKAALAAVPSALKTGTHLLKFVDSVNGLRGWGRGLKKAIQLWFKGRKNETLALQLVKYKQREGWSMKDVLRLAKPVPETEVQGKLFGWTAKNEKAEWAKAPVAPGDKALDFVWATEQAAQLKLVAEQADTAEAKAILAEANQASVKKLVDLIVTYRLPREALPTEALNKVEVWEALLQEMPMTAMIRNLGTMSKIGLLKPLSDAEKLVFQRLTDAERLRGAKVHPIQVLSALRTYSSGRGVRSAASWNVSTKVVEALDEAFELSFGAVEPAGTRHLLGLDVSGSMSGGEIAGVPGLSPSAATAALAVVAARTEPWTAIMGFADSFRNLGITAKDRVDVATRKVSGLTFGSTDASLPMTWALQNKIQVDTFVVMTDNETWAGNIQPVQALEKYRQATGIGAKLIVVGMTSTGFTIADPDDAGMLDVVGFDGATPALMAKFAKGEI